MKLEASSRRVGEARIGSQGTFPRAFAFARLLALCSVLLPRQAPISTVFQT